MQQLFRTSRSKNWGKNVFLFRIYFSKVVHKFVSGRFDTSASMIPLLVPEIFHLDFFVTEVFLCPFYVAKRPPELYKIFNMIFFINGFHPGFASLAKIFSLAIIACLSLFIMIKKKSQECVSFKQFLYFNLIPRKIVLVVR